MIRTNKRIRVKKAKENPNVIILLYHLESTIIDIDITNHQSSSSWRNTARRREGRRRSTKEKEERINEDNDNAIMCNSYNCASFSYDESSNCLLLKKKSYCMYTIICIWKRSYSYRVKFFFFFCNLSFSENIVEIVGISFEEILGEIAEFIGAIDDQTYQPIIQNAPLSILFSDAREWSLKYHDFDLG